MLLVDKPVSAENPLSVLVLCTGNSARSIMAEGLLRHYGAGWIRAESAGSHPLGRVNPLALEQLRQLELPDFEPRSKSWLAFTGTGAQPLDVVITVCDNAACEESPEFPGNPSRVHWGLPDPAAVRGSEAERRAAFADCFAELDARIQRLSACLDSGSRRPDVLDGMLAVAAEAGAD
jgi:arsenate reductase (thioredoxin)